MNIFLANIGNRDLAYKANNLFYVYFEKKCEYWKDIAYELGLKDYGTRFATEKLNANFGQYSEHLIAPIIFPSLELALTRVDAIDSLIMFVTDNPKGDEKNWKWDTIEAGKILEKLIREEENLMTGIKNIKVVKAELANPSDYDEAYNFIRHKLDTLFQNKIENIFTTISGGIPAMNSALRSYTIERFGIKAHLIQKDEPSDPEKEDGIYGPAKFINSWNFRKTAILRIVTTLLQRYDYEGVLELLKDESINDASINKLCAHGKARFNFDFKGAEGVLTGITFSNQLIKNLKQSASNHTGLQRISEIAFNAEILLERGDLIGFLTRAASFRELVINTLGNALGVTFSKSDMSFAKKLKTVTEATSKMPPSKTKNQMDSILKKISWQSNLTRLCDLRNSSLHHGQGISVSDIEAVLPNSKKGFPLLSSNIIDDLLELENLFSHKIQINEPSLIYNELNQMILLLLDDYEA